MLILVFSSTCIEQKYLFVENVHLINAFRTTFHECFCRFSVSLESTSADGSGAADTELGRQFRGRRRTAELRAARRPPRGDPVRALPAHRLPAWSGVRQPRHALRAEPSDGVPQSAEGAQQPQVHVHDLAQAGLLRAEGAREGGGGDERWVCPSATYALDVDVRVSCAELEAVAAEEAERQRLEDMSEDEYDALDDVTKAQVDRKRLEIKKERLKK